MVSALRHWTVVLDALTAEDIRALKRQASSALDVKTMVDCRMALGDYDTASAGAIHAARIRVARMIAHAGAQP